MDPCTYGSHPNVGGRVRPLEVASSVSLKGISHQTASHSGRHAWFGTYIFLLLQSCGQPTPREALSCWQVAKNLHSASLCCTLWVIIYRKASRKANSEAAVVAAGRASSSVSGMRVFLLHLNEQRILDSIDNHFGCLQGTVIGVGEGMCVRILISVY